MYRERIQKQLKISTTAPRARNVTAQNKSRHLFTATASRKSGGHGTRTRNRQSRQLISNQPPHHSVTLRGLYV